MSEFSPVSSFCFRVRRCAVTNRIAPKHVRCDVTPVLGGGRQSGVASISIRLAVLYRRQHFASSSLQRPIHAFSQRGWRKNEKP
jgi:hypothetical protein